MTKEGYWIKNKTKLQLNERSYNAFEMGVKFCENKIAELTQENAELEQEVKYQTEDSKKWQNMYKQRCEECQKLAKENAELKHNKKTVVHLADYLEKMKDKIIDLEKQIKKMKELLNRYYEVCVQIPKEYRTMSYDSCLEDTRQLVAEWQKR